MIVRESSPLVVERSATDAAFINGLWAGRLEAVTVVGGAALLWRDYNEHDDEFDDEEGEYAVDYNEDLKETRALMRELELEAGADRLITAIEKPPDGTYTGDTAEEDGGDQSASTTLTFDESGGLTGDGFDGVDGAYTVDGRWAGQRVAWMEEYDDGFTVALRGQILPNGSIRAMWASSRGIGGAVTLDAPKQK